jgi:predicted Zn-dependent protease
LETLFYRLPNELQEREKQEEKDVDATKDRPKKPRMGDYQLPEAFTYEWHYRIVPPVGFQAKPLPPNSKSLLGPSVLTEEFAKDNDGTVRVTMRFDTVKRRFTAAEAKELKEKASQIREGPAVFIYFEPTAQALMNQGKIKEAFQATRALIVRHPKEAVHHLQRAKMLLAGGMGQSARDEARAAIRLEPNSALAQKTLAEILEYDLVGRQYRRGSDLAGAEAAFRAAKKLDPHDEEITGNLAILLEYNQEGERYGPGARLKESAEEYKSLKAEELGKIGLKNNPAFTYFYAGDFAGAKKYAESLNPQLNSVIVASEAALNGTEAGMAEARKRTGSEADLKTALKGAAELLMRARKYGAAAVLMEAGASGNNASNSIALAATLKKTIPREQIKYKDDPEDAVKQFEMLVFDPQLTSQKMIGILSRSALKVWENYDTEKAEQVLRAGRVGRNALSRTGLPADVLLDITLQMMEAKAEGSDRDGYRVTLRRPGQRNMTMYVAKEGDKYKVLDTGDVPNAVGYEVLDRLQAGNLGGARVLLDWVREEQHLAGGDDPLSGSAFPRLWTKGKEADAEHMKLAAAALLAQATETARDAEAILEPSFHSATIETEKLSLGLALLDAYRNLDAYEKAEAIASEFAKAYPESKRLFFAREVALRGLGRFAEADALAQDLSKRLPDDLDVTRAFIFTAVAHEDYAAVHELEQKLIGSGKAEASDLNNLAWYALFTGKVEQRDLEAATKGAQLSQNSPSILHTLGCVYAELGKAKEAREVLIQAMDQLFLDEPDPNYWYALGRIAEQDGENEVAAVDYRQVKKPKKAAEVPGSSYKLAQIRIAAMGGSPEKKSR